MVSFVRPPARHAAIGIALASAACAGCGDDGTNPAPVPLDPGALIDVTFESRVGVLLDELPDAVRTRVADDLLAKPSSFWEARARRQVEATLYRLVYRNFYYDDRGQLPLPPVEQWKIEPGAAERVEIDGHDLVAVPYGFSSTLLAPVDEPAAADPALNVIGGVVEEAFVLPIDPEHLLERTGFACMNESDFPPNSVDTENARFFFDDTCEAGESEDGCHLTAPIPTVSCVEALEQEVGRVDVTVRFERVAWNAARADDVRVGEQRPGGPQLEALTEGLEDNRITYRYFAEDSCAIAEGCVGGPGWRRLLHFTATVKNRGAVDMAIGDVGPESIAVANKLVSFSACHQHMHFNHYGKFAFGSGDQAVGGKRAFCLESTSRYFNNEASPLTHPYSCDFQGTAAGWGDDYIAGLDCQWVDVTTLDTKGGLTAPLTFHYNADEFLCEGELILDAEGNPTFEPTEFQNEAGETESRFACKSFADAADDNVATIDVTLPEAGGMVTQACARYQVGDKRNCGFHSAGAPLACTPGARVSIECTGGSEDAPAAVRACEASAVLGAIPCMHREALGVVVQTGTPTAFDVTCPPARSATEPGGLVGIYVGPLVDGDDVSGVTCAIAP